MPVSDERREQRAKEAQKHVGLMRGVFGSDVEATVNAAVIYEDGKGRALELPEAAFEATETSVTTDYAPKALLNIEGKAALIDPCAFTRPGGGYLEGSFGPEQIICAESTLYPVLADLKRRYHDANRGFAAGQLFTDRALYLPDIIFNHNGIIRTADVIALPEPNFARAKENNRGEAERNQAIQQRIATFLNIASANGCETVICGAFGCGRQGYPTDQVISIFQAWLAAHPGSLKALVFAVPRAQFAAFDAAFGKPAPQCEPDIVADEDVDEPDIHDIDLPEGITLR